MAVAAPLVAAAAGALVKAGVGAALGGILGATAVGIIGSVAGGIASFGINSLFGSKQKRPEVTPLAATVAGVTEEIVETAQPQAVVIGRMRVAGALAYVAERPNGAQKNGFLYTVHAMAGHKARRIEQVFLDDDPISASKFAALARVEWKLGTPTQGPLDLLVTGTGGEWSADHRGRGIVLVGAELKYDESVFRGARPVVRALGEWLDEVYDPRTGTTGYSTNAALVTAWYLTARDAAGVPYGFGLDWQDLDEAALIASANICDEIVPIPGGQERRYQVNGAFRRDEPREQVLAKLEAAMAGTAHPAQDGKWRIQAGAWQPPIATITADWLRDAYEYRPDRPLDELYNVVRATYLRPDANWQVTDAPVLEDLDALAEDEGEEEASDLEFGLTTSGWTVQRLMRIALAMNRLQGQLTLPCKLHGLTVRPGDVVTVELPDVPVATWRVRTLSIVDNAQATQLVLERWEPSLFGFDVAQYQPLGETPGIVLPDGAVIGTPTITVTPPTAPVPASVSVSWSSVPGASSYDLDWRLPNATAWTSTSQAGTSATISTGDRASFRVRARDAGGLVGNWRDAPFPAALQTWSVVGSAAGFTVSWTGAGKVQVFTSAGTTFSAATKVATDPTASPTDIAFAAGAVNVWIRAVSAEGVVGPPLGPLAVVAQTTGGGDGGSQGAPGEGGGGGEGGGADGGGGGGGGE